ncbi:MAG: translation initiation factor IF-2 subunit gamma [Thermofilum sp. ex4484_79]|nr:MAG: translation initiation factor IF-2 subunit gamma [Thermofilum sp. ex4484_79]
MSYAEELEEAKKMQPLTNIGTAGHVDHGKTTLVEALTGIWASRYSEELRRGITLKIGYADTAIYKCPECPPIRAYYTEATAPDLRCKYCGSDLVFQRRVSFVDVPGHEMLMAVMLSGAALMDGVIFLIDASQPCPRPQTREHFMALTVIGIKNIVFIQNKIDIVSKERAKENYREIKEFLSGTWAEDTPIIPISALHKVNIDVLLWAIEDKIPTPKRDPTKKPLMLIARSFDVNKPGTKIEELQGGVIGGTIIQGRFEIGDEIELRPGRKVKDRQGTRYEELYTTITSLKSGKNELKVAYPGGLVGVGTTLDPGITKSDNLIGNVAGLPGELPPTWNEFRVEYYLLERIVGTEELKKVEPIRKGETLMINVGTAVTLGQVTVVQKDEMEIKLYIPVCAEEDSRIAMSRQIGGRWRLIGYGYIRG